MIKGIKILLKVFLGVFVVSVIVLVIAFQKFDINKYKPQIIKKVSSQLKRQVRIDDIKLKFDFTQGVSIKLTGVKVADDRQFSAKDVFSVDTISLTVDLKAYFAEKQISITQINILNPELFIVEHFEQGNSLTALADSLNQNETAEKGKYVSVKKVKEDVIFPELLIKSLKIKGAHITYERHVNGIVEKLFFKDISLKTANFSLESPFKFKMTGALLSNEENISVKGLARLDLLRDQFRFDDLQIETNVGTMSYKYLKALVPSLDELGLRKDYFAKVNLTVDQIIFDRGRLPVISLNGNVKNGYLHFDALNEPLTDMSFSFTMTNKDFQINDILIKTYGGEIVGSVSISDIISNPYLSTDVQFKDLAIEQVLKDYDLPINIEGGLVFDAKVKGAMGSLPEVVIGDVNAIVMEGKLIDVNILNMILRQLDVLPYLTQQLTNKLSEKYKENLIVKDTVLEVVIFDSKIKENKLYYTAQIKSEDFEVLLNGVVGLNQQVTIDTQFYISEELSKSFVEEVVDLEALLDNKKRINVPLKAYNGPLNAIKILPDLKVIGEKIIKAKGKKELRNVIHKALNIDDSPAHVESNPENRELKPKPKPTLEQQLLDTIINEIPIFR
ncbi:MAG: hypothetical protein ACI9F2_001204 [Lysobacterales bacterium]|jgi:hypothetical protein